MMPCSKAASARPAPLPSPPPLDRIDRPALFLDFDGTLVDLVDRPETVEVDGTLAELIDALATRLDGRLAIVSGRSVAQLDGFLGEAGLRLALSGSHGAETRWRNEPAEAPAPAPSLARAIEAVEAFAADRPGTLVERKGIGVALHYRMVPDAHEDALALIRRLGAEHGLPVQTGKMMVELKSTDATKGAAVTAFMARPEFAGATPVFVGDDLTDEAGFVQARAAGGHAVLVGPERETEADWRLDDVAAVRKWLAGDVQ